MWTFAPLWLALAAAVASPPCPAGRPCPLAPVRAAPDGKAYLAPPALGAVQCPDGESECPDNSTCCVMPTGAWGCCPMPEASCCADKLHCCPRATVCDLARGRCLTPSRRPAPVALGRVLCPDGRSACPDGATCCQLPSAQYGCCPLQNAVCCGDGLHCCPQGTACDLERAKCTSARGPPRPLTRLPVALAAVGDVRCDDETSCPDGNTCCRLGSGKWGCCPLEQAVCCPDHVHCCPQGYTCDPEGGSCLQGGGRVPWREKRPALARGRDVRCDDETSCPDGNTCCRLGSGKWGCCPLEQAVCCPDHVHCCPQGYTCDPEGGSCLQGGGRVPWREKRPALARGRDVRCDDETSCPDGNTCCRLGSGKWGCCPLEQAVCCSDGFHCCPQGYTCDPAQGTCHKAPVTVPWATKVPAARRGHAVQCNATASCADGQTCCRSLSGDWACCQLPSAVCCKDRQHCCPRGYTCDVARQSCEKRRAPGVPATSPAPLLGAGATATATATAVPCDATRSCDAGQRCCPGPDGSWGCCPYAQGSCCPGGQHCCPPGYRCASGSCTQRRPPRWDLALPRRVLL